MGEDEDYDLEYSEDFSTSACSKIQKSEQISLIIGLVIFSKSFERDFLSQNLFTHEHEIVFLTFPQHLVPELLGVAALGVPLHNHLSIHEPLPPPSLVTDVLAEGDTSGEVLEMRIVE